MKRQAARVCKAWAETCRDRGIVPYRDAKSKAILAGQSMILLRKGWEPEVLIEAAIANATGTRNPAFLAEWARLTAASIREIEWERIKFEDRVESVGWVRRINASLSAQGFAPIGAALTKRIAAGARGCSTSNCSGLVVTGETRCPGCLNRALRRKK